MQDKLEILKTVVDAYGIRFAIRESPWLGIEDFDEGLRRQLYQDYDYGFIIRQLKDNCHENMLYLAEDAFLLYYIIFRLPESEKARTQYVMIGPYLVDDNEPDPMEIVGKMGLELYHVQILKTFYAGIVAMHRFENIILSLIKSLFPEMTYEIAHTGLNFQGQPGEAHLRIREEKCFTMEIVEERYRYENAILDAVEHGNETAAMLAIAKMGRFSMEKRSKDNLRNDKNSLIIFNVLLRKAVEKAGVHPYYIDELSSSIARRIEAARNTADIMRINREIIRKYCLLVRNHGMRGYSEMVDQCVNYIELNLAEELSLNGLAARFNINSSYLSQKFKKEVGQTVTDYINEKRIGASLEYLATTRLPIGEVAEMVGILNENYYSRLFRRLRGMTPREYRERMAE